MHVKYILIKSKVIKTKDHFLLLDYDRDNLYLDCPKRMSQKHTSLMIYISNPIQEQNKKQKTQAKPNYHTHIVIKGCVASNWSGENLTFKQTTVNKSLGNPKLDGKSTSLF